MAPNRLTGYDKALHELQVMVVAQCTAVRQQVAEAVIMLDTESQAGNWREKDDLIDRQRDAIVNRGFELMSWQQLRTQDLRWILGFQRIAQELERIADYACDLAELCQLRPKRKFPAEIKDMAQHLLGMLDFDVGIIKEERPIDVDLDELDNVLDEIYARFRRELAREDEHPDNSEHHASANSAVDLGIALLLARTIERMGDHAVNVAETVLYIRTGQRRIGTQGG